ncbi:uncharacterized protein LOC131596502 [Vicia villosa]|uniref:uncharacterized protein LOC131596502 n=1 Tax=Vicia villosa TaxID=3911 RepID=UPI00273AC22B|nr:uncharacterized protein LOC131596502 [Vicia villosa]
MDADLMETEASSSGQNNDIRELLTLARQLINQGKPSQALQAVVVAVKNRGGDEAVFQSLDRARELYKSRLQQNAAADQLASLFAECAIAEVQPALTEPLTEPSATTITNPPSVTTDANGTSILAESGRMQVVLDAGSDGSSFICLKCGGLVSIQRKDEHYAYWCC